MSWTVLFESANGEEGISFPFQGSGVYSAVMSHDSLHVAIQARSQDFQMWCSTSHTHFKLTSPMLDVDCCLFLFVFNLWSTTTETDD